MPIIFNSLSAINQYGGCANFAGQELLIRQLLQSPDSVWNCILKYLSTFLKIQLYMASKNTLVLRNLYLAFCLKHSR
jgi:hypothetical protein